MKKVFLLLYLLLIIKIYMVLPMPEKEIPKQEAPAAEELISIPVEAKPAPEKLKLLVGEEIREMSMQDYLNGVVSAEMPASFPVEALKAQAVAARSYAIYCMSGAKHGQADLCSSSACCQAWQSEEKQREKWGEDYELYADKIKSAVEATFGEYLCYEGQAVLAAFHSSSAGFTENSSALWAELPYLKSVDSPENSETVPNYVSTVSCSPLDFRDTLLRAKHYADFTGDEKDWIGSVQRNESGRIEKVQLGGVDFSGAELRQYFSLRSTAFELEYAEGLFCFTVTGYGHGIGMSQYGAKHMAQDGADYRSILAHYYPGTYLS